MKVLWLCNVALPEIAHQLNMEASNKEGWLSGIAHAVLQNAGQNQVEIAIAFPAPRELCDETGTCNAVVKICDVPVQCYGFYEDIGKAEQYDISLEQEMEKIFKMAEADILHCFGTEYPHTLAACKVFPDRDKILVGLQGLCSLLAEAYFANLPESVIRSKTFRDILRQDSLLQQQEKFRKRGQNEQKIVALAGNITGRTLWDRTESAKWNPSARYFRMNENLRKEFYGPVWSKDKCIPHSIFLSQGDYPLKGLHYMLLALPGILEKYPDAKVYVAGNSLVAYETWKDKLKISAYGKYLRRLISKYHLEDKVVHLGRLNAVEMRDRYLQSHLFVCCSSLENSPNSLGEAMILGLPCVAANVGGIPSLFEGGKDGIAYPGFGSDINNGCDFKITNDTELKNIAKRLENAVVEMWSDEAKMLEYCKNARNHARKTHDNGENFAKMMEIYAKIQNGEAGDS